MATKRVGISKKTRFEVFKRDGFVCQYCGAHPPSVLLHVDHIIAVAAGGKNSMDNYVTSCEPCNLGKGARALTAIPESLKDKSARIAEQEEQLLGYQEIMERRRQRIEDELWRVADELQSNASIHGMSRQWTSSIRMFIERLGVHTALDAAEKARAKHPYGNKNTFLYFCGICWNIIKANDGAVPKH